MMQVKIVLIYGLNHSVILFLVVGGAIGGTLGGIILIIALVVTFASVYTCAKKSRSRRTPGPVNIARSTAWTNVATNETQNIQLNTLSSSSERPQAQQQPPQYSASPTIASCYPPPQTFPSNLPTGTSHGGYYVYVPPGMALPPSSHFYPYPVATLQHTPRDPDTRPEPPHYDEIAGCTPTSTAV